MTATVKEFCRINGLDEKSENLVDLIYEVLAGGATDRITEPADDTQEKSEVAVSDCSA